MACDTTEFNRLTGIAQMTPRCFPGIRTWGIKVQVTYPQKGQKGLECTAKRTSRRYQVPSLMFHFQHFAGR